MPITVAQNTSCLALSVRRDKLEEDFAALPKELNPDRRFNALVQRNSAARLDNRSSQQRRWFLRMRRLRWRH